MAVPCEVMAGQISVRGLSLGGVETCLQIPQLGIMFDVGHAPRSFAGTPRLLITHGHADHCAGLIGLLSNRLLIGRTDPLHVYAPAPIVDGLRRAVEAYESFQHEPYRWQITPVAPGDDIPLSNGRFARVFGSVNVIHTVGYTVFERVRKLREPYKSLQGAEIGRLKRAGADIFDQFDRPLVSFPGDTAIHVVEQIEHLQRTQVLILESTYLDERKTVAQCVEHGHIHLDQVLSRADLFQNQHIVFTHFSQAYRPQEVREIIERRAAPKLQPEVHALLPDTTSWPG